MTSPDSAPIASQAVPFEKPGVSHAATPAWAWLSLVVGATGLGCSLMLWQKVDGMQEQLARQTAEATTQAVEARALARESQDLVRDASAKLSVMEARVNEVSLQRGQLDTLVQNLTRSRDETLVVDLESAIRMAQQQAQLTGSTEPLVAALHHSIKRLERSTQPRLITVQQAMERDLERLSRTAVTDTASLLARLDDVVRLVDDLHVQNSAPLQDTQRQPERKAPQPQAAQDASVTPAQWAWWSNWGHRIWQGTLDEARDLLRVSRIEHADAMLMAPEQAFFLRENLKLKLLNARLAVLARQYDAARADIGTAQASLNKYFEVGSRRTHQAQSVLAQLQTHLQATQQPSLEDTLTALSTAATGL
ncbi:uroporphyrinogen-III C-methyltransferase [Comamonas aquatica]|uniref:uroporphyrinogen-III C-methyltransferase n=1 Tax=Comamonas aquatica TaxID=225991 RepID=UPI0034D7482D